VKFHAVPGTSFVWHDKGMIDRGIIKGDTDMETPGHLSGAKTATKKRVADVSYLRRRRT
jgi:hypothetical protein